VGQGGEWSRVEREGGEWTSMSASKNRDLKKTFALGNNHLSRDCCGTHE